MAALERRFDRRIPWGTALVNLVAAFLLGLLVGSDPTEGAGRLLGAGFLGSFSTFSTWLVEGVFMGGTGTRRQLVRTTVWLVGLLLIGIVAFGFGHSLTR